MSFLNIDIEGFTNLPRIGAAVKEGQKEVSRIVDHVVQRLFTPEDPHQLHKTLGVLSLVSFWYRYYYIVTPDGGLGFQPNANWIDSLTILLHMGLSLSAAIFHVLRHRLLGRPLIIYEEYRLHAMIFSLKSCSIWFFAVHLRPAVAAYAATLPDDTAAMRAVKGNLVHALLYFTYVAHHLGADYVSKKFGTAGQTAVRVKGTAPDEVWWRVAGQRFYSFYQFVAVASHMYGCDRLADMGWNTLIAIQSSAFLMTLFRKNLINGYTHAAIYTACLVVSEYHMYLAHASVAPQLLALVIVAFTVRLHCHHYLCNKYVLWGAFSVITSPFFKEHCAPRISELAGVGISFRQ